MKKQSIDSDLRFRRLSANSYSGMTFFDKDFHIKYRSPTSERLTGWPTTKRLNITIGDMVHPDDKNEVVSLLKEVRQTPGLSLTATFRSKHYAGHDLWLQATYTNMLDEPGVEAIVCSFIDITDQKKTETDYRKQTEQINELLEEMADGFASLNDDLCYTYVNPQLLKLVGKTKEELIGKYIWDVFPEAVGSVTWEAINTALLDKTYACKVDLYQPLQLWQESRIYPSANGISIFVRDVTQQKNEELEKELLAEVSQIFNEPLEFKLLQDKLLKKLVSFGHFTLAEIWLIGTDKNKLNLSAKYEDNEQARSFYRESKGLSTFIKGNGFPGIAWETLKIQRWAQFGERSDCIRDMAAETVGITSAYAIPLLSENSPVGVLVLGLNKDLQPIDIFMRVFEILSTYLGAEIRRKQLEVELDQLFNLAPDIICITGVDKYFKKVNPAMCRLLEYTKDELLQLKITDLIHPEDREKCAAAFEGIETDQTFYYEDRFITRSGKTKWLSWTATRSAEEDLLFCVAKNINDKKELEVLLDKITDLALIGGWEIMMPEGKVYWSKNTRLLHEVSDEFEPNIETGISFYREGESRDTISHLMERAVQEGKMFDAELEIITAKGNIRWVRVVGEPEFINGKCVRVYGSFQDVNERVRAQLKAKEALLERNVILESIGDAFFAVDKNWTVTYWNKRAAEILRQQKDKVVGQNLWDIFSNSTDTESFRKYHLAMQTGEPIHFEDFYETLKTWYEISAYPTGSGLSVYFHDITERKRSELLLMESEKRYSELFQLSPIPNFVFDLDSLYFLDVNEAALAHYGYTRDEFLQLTIMDIRPLEEIDQIKKVLAEYRNNKTFTLQPAIDHRKKNGDIIQVDIQSNTIRYKGRNARIVIARDITQSLNHLKAIQKQNERLKEISWMQSHIIRGPLVRIMGLVPLIEDTKGLSDETRQMLEFLSVSAKELDEVIQNIIEKANRDKPVTIDRSLS
jgi:PAS domain S-box-containing protein